MCVFFAFKITWREVYLGGMSFRSHTGSVTAVTTEAGHSNNLRLLRHIPILVRVELGRVWRDEVTVAMLRKTQTRGKKVVTFYKTFTKAPAVKSVIVDDVFLTSYKLTPLSVFSTILRTFSTKKSR